MPAPHGASPTARSDSIERQPIFHPTCSMARCKNPDDDRYQFGWSGRRMGLKGACEGGPVPGGGLGAQLELIEDAKPVWFAFCGGE